MSAFGAGLGRFKNEYRARYFNADRSPQIPLDLQPGQNALSIINDYFKDKNGDADYSSSVDWETSSKYVVPQNIQRMAASPRLFDSVSKSAGTNQRHKSSKSVEVQHSADPHRRTPIKNAFPSTSVSGNKTDRKSVLLHESGKNAVFAYDDEEGEEDDADGVNGEAILFVDEMKKTASTPKGENRAKPLDCTFILDDSAVQEPATPTVKLPTKKRLSFTDTPLWQKSKVVVTPMRKMSEREALGSTTGKTTQSKFLHNFSDVSKKSVPSPIVQLASTGNVQNRMSFSSAQSPHTIIRQATNENKMLERPLEAAGLTTLQGSKQSKKLNHPAEERAKRPFSSIFLQATTTGHAVSRLSAVVPDPPVPVPAPPEQQAVEDEFIIDEADSFIFKSWISIPKKGKPTAKEPMSMTVEKSKPVTDERRAVSKVRRKRSPVSADVGFTAKTPPRKSNKVFGEERERLASQSVPKGSSFEGRDLVTISERDGTLSGALSVQQNFSDKESNVFKSPKKKVGNVNSPLQQPHQSDCSLKEQTLPKVSSKKLKLNVRKQGRRKTVVDAEHLSSLEPLLPNDRDKSSAANIDCLSNKESSEAVHAFSEKHNRHKSPWKRRHSKRAAPLERGLPSNQDNECPNSASSHPLTGSSEKPYVSSEENKVSVKQKGTLTPKSSLNKQQNNKRDERQQLFGVENQSCITNEHRSSGRSQRIHKRPSFWWMVSPTQMTNTKENDKQPIHATRMKKQKTKNLKEKTLSKFSDSQTCESLAKCESPKKSSVIVITNKEPSPINNRRRPRQIASDYDDDDDDDDEDCGIEARSSVISVVKDVQGLSTGKQARKRKVPEDMATQEPEMHQIPQKLTKSKHKKGKKDKHPIHVTRMKKQKIKHFKEKTVSKFSYSQTCEGVAKCDSSKKNSAIVIANKEPSPMSKRRRPRQIASDDDDDEDCCTEAQSSIVKVVLGLSAEKQPRKRKVTEDMATQDSEMHQIPQKLKKSILKKDIQRVNRPIPLVEPEKEGAEEKEDDGSTVELFVVPQMRESRVSALRQSLVPSSQGQKAKKFRDSLASFGSAYAKSPFENKRTPQKFSENDIASKASPKTPLGHHLMSPRKRVNLESPIKSPRAFSGSRGVVVVNPDVVQDTHSEEKEAHPVMDLQVRGTPRKYLSTWTTPIPQSYEPDDIASDEDSSSEVTSNTVLKVPHGAGVHGNKSSIYCKSGSGPTVSRAIRLTCPDEKPIVYDMYESSATDEEETENCDEDIRRKKIALPSSTPNVRRSKRTKVKPLAYWRGERVDYKIRPSGGFVVDGVVSPEKERPRKDVAKRKNAHKKQAAEIPCVENRKILPAEPTVVVHPTEGTEVLVECIKTAENCTFHGAKELISICKSIQQSTFSTGKLTIGPLQEKGYQYVCLDTIVYYIIHGSLKVTVHLTSYLLKTGDYFFVPPGNMYNIQNLQREEAVLLFTQIKGRAIETNSC